MSLSKTKIPWANYTKNPVKGLCPMPCTYCYAKKFYRRFKWDTTIRLEPEVISGEVLSKIPDGSRVFVGSTIELFGDWIKKEWLDYIFKMCILFPKITFIFLTKQPHNLMRYSPFPKNCWILVSATDQQQYLTGLKYLRGIEATIKGFSFEPLLYKINTSYDTLDWAIIGSRTQPLRHPSLDWVSNILDSAKEFKTPVFIKEPLASYMNINRQEFPEVK